MERIFHVLRECPMYSIERMICIENSLNRERMANVCIGWCVCVQREWSRYTERLVYMYRDYPERIVCV